MPASPSVLSGFTGHQQDDDIGLVNMVGRLFDSEVGRFMAADPFVQRPLWSGISRS